MIKILIFGSFLPLAFAGSSPSYSVTRAKVLTTKTSNPFVTAYTAIAEQTPARPLKVQTVQNLVAYSSPQPPPVPVLPPLPRVVPVQAPLTVPLNVEPFDSHPQYNFAYQVHDDISGTNQGHSEDRDGDIVRGRYSVLDPDGYLRVVTYTSDPVNGFNAVVDRQPQTIVKRGAVIQTPVYAQAQPVQLNSAAPKLQYAFSYSNPSSSYGYSF